MAYHCCRSMGLHRIKNVSQTLHSDKHTRKPCGQAVLIQEKEQDSLCPLKRRER